LLCTAEHYDLILVEFWHQAEKLLPLIASLKRTQPNLNLITDTVDIHFLRELAEFELNSSNDESILEGIQTRMRRELATYSHSDLVIVVTQEDQKALADKQCTVPTELVPIIVSPSARSANPDPNTILFIGGFKHKPNIDAVLWFVHEVFPLIRSKIPDAIFRVVGSYPTEQILELNAIPGVEIVGFVKETIDQINKACVSVAPLRFGAGMKGKVIEALSYGLPVVTTSFGAQGLNATDGKHLRIADEAFLFAEYVCECLRNPINANRMGQQGQLLIENLCGPESVKTILKKRLEPELHNRSSQTWSPGRRLAKFRCWAIQNRSRLKRFFKSLLSKLLRTPKPLSSPR
jgi:glycosyltransferase involved in cell wall biosynthesis